MNEFYKRGSYHYRIHEIKAGGYAIYRSDPTSALDLWSKHKGPFESRYAAMSWINSKEATQSDVVDSIRGLFGDVLDC